MIYPSIYHATGKFQEVVGEIKERPLTKEEKPFAKNVLRTLAQFDLLNQSNLETYLQIERYSKWKKDNLPRVLRCLRKKGHIAMYERLIETDATEQATESPLRIYQLTKAGRAYLEQQGETVPTTPICVETAEIETIMECLTTNQWHIHILKACRETMQEAYRNSFVITGDSLGEEGNSSPFQWIIPSVVRYSPTQLDITDKETKNGFFFKKREPRKESITLFAWPAPKKKEALTSFCEQLLASYMFLMHHPKYMPAMFVVLCEDLCHASEVACKLNAIRQMRPLSTVLYAVDSATTSEHFLSMLYTVTPKDSGVLFGNLNLT